MTAPDLPAIIADRLNFMARRGESDSFIQLKATPAPDGRTVTVEVRPIGFGTIGDQAQTLALHIVSLGPGPAAPANDAVDPVIATSSGNVT
jgi:hypothetical protein